jgi:hypothetical protein
MKIATIENDSWRPRCPIGTILDAKLDREGFAIIQIPMCKTLVDWVHEGKKYTVELSDNQWSCSCGGTYWFETTGGHQLKTCKHTRAAWEKHEALCQWNVENDPSLMPNNEACPLCGGPVAWTHLALTPNMYRVIAKDEDDLKRDEIARVRREGTPFGRGCLLDRSEDMKGRGYAAFFHWHLPEGWGLLSCKPNARWGVSFTVCPYALASEEERVKGNAGFDSRQEAEEFILALHERYHAAKA